MAMLAMSGVQPLSDGKPRKLIEELLLQLNKWRQRYGDCDANELVNIHVDALIETRI